MMHSVRFAKDEQGRRKGQEVLFKWPDIEKKLGEHKHIYVVDARLGSNNHTHRLWYDVIPPHTEEGQEWRTLGHRHTVEAIIYFLQRAGATASSTACAMIGGRGICSACRCFRGIVTSTTATSRCCASRRPPGRCRWAWARRFMRTSAIRSFGSTRKKARMRARP